MLIVEIDVIHAESLERRITGPAHVLGAAVYAVVGTVVPVFMAELGSEDDLVPPAHDRPADELLVGERTVHVGGVEEVDAEIEGAVNGRDRLRVIAARVEVGHPHAAEAERGDAEALGAKGTVFESGH